MAAGFLRVDFVVAEEDDLVVGNSRGWALKYAGLFSFLRKGESRFPFLNDSPLCFLKGKWLTYIRRARYFCIEQFIPLLICDVLD